VFDEIGAAAEGYTGKLAEGRSRAEGALLAYVEGGDWPAGGGIGDNGWRRSSGACRQAMIEGKLGGHPSSSRSAFASFRSGVSKPSVNQP
jgi:hypothetical protein